VYLLFSARLFAPDGPVTFGTQVYDHYFLSLLDGRFDVPLRIVGLEGHYDPDGRAFVYHGLAPLLSRLLVWPFLDLRNAAFSGMSVWLFAVGGTIAYHLLFDRIVSEYGPRDASRRRFWRLWTGVAIWASGPGILLAANDSLFHEPIAVGYFCAGWYLYAMARVVVFGGGVAPVIVPLAILSGVAVHARPHLAIGLYTGCLLLMGHHMVSRRGEHLRRMALALGILAAFGGALLAVNQARFGSPTRMHGTFEASELQYGFTYWGVEDPEGPRAIAYREHGRFNPRRVLPNALVYAVDVPEVVDGRIDAAYRALTRGLGYSHVELPRVGFVFLWAPWLVLAGLGLRAPPVDTRLGWVAVAGPGVAALLLLMFGTVTLRYRVDLWPFLAATCMLAMPRLLIALRDVPTPRASRVALVLGLAGGVLVSGATALAYTDDFASGGIFAVWPLDVCEGMVQRRGFSGARATELCVLEGRT